MSLSLILACFWAVVANIIAMTPGREDHLRQAIAVVIVGIPIAGLVTFQHGPMVGLLVLIGACAVLRCPLIYLRGWLFRRDGPQAHRLEEPAE